MEQIVLIGDLCNNNCNYCKDKSFNKSFIQLKKEVNCFDKLKLVTIEGGEPCMHKDFFNLLDYMKKEGFQKIKIISNGRIFSYSAFLNKVVQSGITHFCIKLPAFYHKTYSNLCKSDGLKQTIKGLENIKKINNVILDIIIKLCRENEKELFDIVMAVSTLLPNKIIVDLEGVELKDKSKLDNVNDLCKMNGVEFETIPKGLIRKEIKKKEIVVPDMKFVIKPYNTTSICTGADPRIVSPLETVQRAKKVINNTTFENIKPFFENKFGVYVYEFNKTKPESSIALKAQYGKGCSKEQALASGYMETIERYCANITSNEKKKLIYSDYEAISDYAIYPNLLDVTQSLPFYNEKGKNLFSSYLPSYMGNAWTWAFSLTNGKPLLVPAALVYKDFISEDNKHFLHSKGLGLGSGNVIEEAIIHGINELMESDALLSLPNPLNYSELDRIPIIDMTTIKGLDENLAKLSNSIFCFYIKSKKYKFDVNVMLPTIFIKLKNGNHAVLSGIACNLNPKNAFNRAISELIENCCRLEVNPLNHPECIINKSEEYKPHTSILFEDLKDYSTISIHKDYLKYKNMLDNAQLNLIVKDLTKKQFNIPVVRVIIPGMNLCLTHEDDNINFNRDSFKFFK